MLGGWYVHRILRLRSFLRFEADDEIAYESVYSIEFPAMASCLDSELNLPF